MSSVITFFDSSFFVALVTGVTGGIALHLYWQRKRDAKKEAASIILLEIRNAERVALQVKEHIVSEAFGLPTGRYLMPTENWNAHKYLFVGDFDRDQWDRINAFYLNCKLYDSALSYYESFFEKDEEQSRASLHRRREKLVAKYVGLNTQGDRLQADQEKIKKEMADFQDAYLGLPSLLYVPKKPTNDAKMYIENLQMDLSQLSVGEKLKKLAKLSR